MGIRNCLKYINLWQADKTSPNNRRVGGGEEEMQEPLSSCYSREHWYWWGRENLSVEVKHVGGWFEALGGNTCCPSVSGGAEYTVGPG